MKKTLFIGLLSIASSILSAQSINFVIEDNTLFFENGDIAGRNAGLGIDNRDQLTVWAGFINDANLTSFETGIGNYNISGSVSGLNETLGSIDWISVSEGSGLFTSSRDFSLTNQGGSEFVGYMPLLLVTDATSFNNLAVGNEVGLVYSSLSSVPELGATTIGFETSNSWDMAYLGNINQAGLTFEAVSASAVVPEPSTYAAICGALMFLFVAYRRRLRK